jgi:hypothetical protein
MRRISGLLVPLFLAAACGGDSDTGDGAPPDTTAPAVTLDVARFALLSGTATVPVTATDEHLAAVRLLEDDAVLAEGVGAALSLDTTTVEDGLHRFSVVAVDEAGNEARTAEVPVIVANHGERVEVTYDPAAEVAIPAAYEGVELDVRATAPSRAGIRKLVAWVTWDPTGDWLLEYALGQGLCPHRGIQYLAEESRDGEIVLELDRADVDPAIVAGYPEADRDSATFPTNDDPLTFGLFFGHVRPTEPAAHAGETLPIEAGLVYLYAE